MLGWGNGFYVYAMKDFCKFWKIFVYSTPIGQFSYYIIRVNYCKYI